jgi:uncharacterized protein YprB with RNaseH-like and TPR domain
MLRNTFLHIRGVGPVTERRIWNAGISTWNDFLRKRDALDIPEKRRQRILEGVEKSIEAFKSGDHGFFRDGLPENERWRAYRDFEKSTAYLDIETTGLGFWSHDITMIGIFDGKRQSTYIKGINLDDFQFELSRYSVIVTFNGSRFDVPFIEAKYPNVKFGQIHLDLRFILRRLGYRGGLKSIESEMGLKRSGDVEDLRGADAVRLWRAYTKGNDKALKLLIKYNSEDVRGLECLMKIAYKEMKKRTLPSQRP